MVKLQAGQKYLILKSGEYKLAELKSIRHRNATITLRFVFENGEKRDISACMAAQIHSPDNPPKREKKKEITGPFPYRCKIGTVPHSVIFRYNYKVEVGKKLTVRTNDDGSQWFQIIVDSVDEDGYFFASKL